MTNAHIISFFLFGAGQILPRCDLQIGVIPLGQLHRAAGQFKQAAVIGDQAGFFRIQLVQRGLAMLDGVPHPLPCDAEIFGNFS